MIRDGLRGRFRPMLAWCRQTFLGAGRGRSFGRDGTDFAATPAKRLNVLWICADDHAPYVLGAYGNRRAQTPNLDRLAAGGMRFDRAFCNSPVCTASRQSFITGRYPRTLGVTQLSTPLPAGDTTLADVLKQAGYDTAAFGKMHFNSGLKHGFEKRLDLADFSEALVARGRTKIPADVRVQPPWHPFKDPARIWLNAAALPIASVDADTSATYFAQQADRFLNEPRDKPFFLFVSFYEPHSPFNFPIEDRGRFDPNQFDAPTVEQQDDWQIPAVFRSLTPPEKQGIAAAYYTSVAFLDRNVGRVLAALEKSGQADRTLVIYTGDHGYLLGQHGRFEKHCSYEEAIRAPLLIRCPGTVAPRLGNPCARRIHRHLADCARFVRRADPGQRARPLAPRSAHGPDCDAPPASLHRVCTQRRSGRPRRPLETDLRARPTPPHRRLRHRASPARPHDPPLRFGNRSSRTA